MDKVLNELPLDEVEDWIAEHIEDWVDEFDYLDVESDDNHRITTDNIRVVIPHYNVELRAGVYYEFDEESNEFTPDWSMTLIYDIQSDDVTAYLAYEQDGMACSLSNYLMFNKLGCLNQAVKCQIILDVE